MKTLLLTLVVVGFVYLDLGYTGNLMCRKCNQTVCELNGTCAEGETRCFIVQNVSDKTGDYAIKGCAKTCPIKQPNERVKCCHTNYCNNRI